MGKNVIEILIKADDKASAKMRIFGTNVEATHKKISSAATRIAAVGVAIGAAIGTLVYQTAKHNDLIAKSAKQLGVSTEFLSEYEYAVKLSGGTLEDFTTGLKRLSRAASDANFGLMTYKRTFDDLGISVTDSNGNLKDSEIIFEEVTEAIAKLDNDTRKAAVAQELFGRGGLKLIPLLNSGAAGIKKMREEAKALGISLSTEAAKKSEEFIDSLTRMKASLRGMAMIITDELEEPLTNYANKLAKESIPNTAEWIKENKDLLSTLGNIGITLTATAIAIKLVSTAIGAVMALPWLALLIPSLIITQINLEKAKDRLQSMVKEFGKAPRVIEYSEKALMDHANQLVDSTEEANSLVDAWQKEQKELVEMMQKTDELNKKMRELADTIEPFKEGEIVEVDFYPERTKAKAETLEQEIERIEEILKRLNRSAAQSAIYFEQMSTGWKFDPANLEYLWIAEENTEALSEAVKAFNLPLSKVIELTDEQKEKLIQLAEASALVKNEFADMPEMIIDTAEAGERAFTYLEVKIEDVGLMLYDNFVYALADVAVEAERAEEVFEHMAKSMIKQLIVLIMKMLLFKAIMAAFGLSKGGEFGGKVIGEVYAPLEAQRGLEAVGGTFGVDTIPAIISRGEVVVPSPTVERLNRFIDEYEPRKDRKTINVNPLFLTGSKMEAHIIAEYLEEKRDKYEPYIVRGNL